MLTMPLTLARIRSVQPALGSVRADRPYFPFELGSPETRPMQGYLFKLPFAFVELFPELRDVPRFGGDAIGGERGGEAAVPPPGLPKTRPELCHGKRLCARGRRALGRGILPRLIERCPRTRGSNGSLWWPPRLRDERRGRLGQAIQYSTSS
jgi:hypothetical protein